MVEMHEEPEGTMINEDRPSSFGADDQDKNASAQEDNFAALETREPTTADAPQQKMIEDENTYA
jgi:hypothetical protein